MGKNYQEELLLLPGTAKWASEQAPIVSDRATRVLRGRSLVVIGSGGSLSAAQFIAQLHTARTGCVAVAMTPLEFCTTDQPIDGAVWFISAGGSNSDILRAWDAAVDNKAPHDLLVMCGKEESPLVRQAREARAAAVIAADFPSGSDGFLATNSLVAFFCFAMRLYGVEPPALDANYADARHAVLDRSTLLVLYGGWLKPVAMDLESRFSEAALGNIQIADFRNFAHGRHHWTAKRSDSTGVVALISPRFVDLANETLKALPSDLEIESWEFSTEDAGVALLGLHRAIFFAGDAGRRLGIDPGRPGVPDFGRQIYELKTPPAPPPELAVTESAIARKIRAGAGMDGLVHECGNFASTVETTRFAGVVLDYDGTVVATRRRFDPIEAGMAASLNRALADGLLVGIATGRGKSVHVELRKAIESSCRERVWIGYYNGGVLRRLSQDCDGLGTAESSKALLEAEHALKAAIELRGATFELRTSQLTVTTAAVGQRALWESVQAVLDRKGISGVKVLFSSHSVDVIPIEVSKAAVVAAVAADAGVSEERILKIGDRGRWPGNDVELLAMSNGLSIDEVSDDPRSCWNFVPNSLKGPAATLFYLDRLRSGRLQIR